MQKLYLYSRATPWVHGVEPYIWESLRLCLFVAYRSQKPACPNFDGYIELDIPKLYGTASAFPINEYDIASCDCCEITAKLDIESLRRLWVESIWQ